MKIRYKLLEAPKYLVFWILLDATYILLLFSFLSREIPLSFTGFLFVHLLSITLGTVVMYSGLGAGILWIPVLTFLNIRPLEAVSISIFTQIAGKGTGSLTYFFNGLVDMKTAIRFTPMALIGVTLGFMAGFYIPLEYERILLYIFLLIAGYLLMKTIQSLNAPEPNIDKRLTPNEYSLYKSYPVVILSSFFTGLLSIGNTDWLIPHMEQKLNMSTSRSVATGLFIMFITIIFYLFLVCVSVWTKNASWPEGTYLLFATCSGVIIGGQVGTRLVRIPWFKNHQKHTFILLLAMSMIHLIW